MVDGTDLWGRVSTAARARVVEHWATTRKVRAADTLCGSSAAMRHFANASFDKSQHSSRGALGEERHGSIGHLELEHVLVAGGPEAGVAQRDLRTW